ncbi:MAG TPA: GNAT family N-acetyltransferase, partial [Gemmataceae bacterium]|nr:GNAT family N-acetyltransferase [Gemmataceae bacterium]
PAVEDALTAAALEHVAGVKSVQTFLPPEEAGRAEPLLRAGFRRVTRVWQMTRVAASGQVSRSSLRSRLTLVAYHDTDPAEFHRTLLRAHDDSLDCPELHGVRSPDEVLAGYWDCAPDLSAWWLARLDDEPAGVLVLGPGDLTFVGVVPERRGHGVGRALVEAAVSWRPELSLTVDDRNVPAISLYRSLGFKPVGSRDVFVWVRSPRSGGAGVTSS